MDHSYVGKSIANSKFEYTWKDLSLYALGIGAKRDELDYLYEGRGPFVYPSFAVVPKFAPMLELLSAAQIDLAMIVHGGERFEIHRPLAPKGILSTKATLRGIYDMRRFATVIIDTETNDEEGQLIATTTSNIIVRDAGGFGGEPTPREEVPSTPKDRPADFRVEETTTPEQALLYRLSGDFNPLHADPDFAKKVGFPDGPILHGLCTYGFAVRHLTKGLLDGAANRIKMFEGQFRRPVAPGETLVTEGWKLEDDRVVFNTSVKERNEVVLGKAWARITP